MDDQDVFPFGLTEESFLHLWHSSLLTRPQIIADLILKSFPFAIPQDRPALVSLLVAQLIEASLRLVAVENALTDRTKSVAHNLTEPLPDLPAWNVFTETVRILQPIQLLHRLNIGEEALVSAELLCSQSDLSFLSELISVAGSKEVVFVPQKENINVIFSLGNNAISVSTDELEVVALADLTADLCSIAKGFLIAYVETRANIYHVEQEDA
jgi:hypothetical protein